MISLPVLSIGTSLAGGASADDQGPTPATARVYTHLLDRFDANHDGLVQTSELPPLTQNRLARADVDRNGVITPEELHRFGVERRAARFARADKDADGKIGPSEVSTLRWDYLKAADADQDGAVTLDEVERAVASGALHRLTAEEAFHVLDRNGDGVIDLTRAPTRERSRLLPADTNHDLRVTLAELKAYRIALGID
jgi:Ca2+-binding EF-hand superfamily protein